MGAVVISLHEGESKLIRRLYLNVFIRYNAFIKQLMKVRR